MIQSVEVVDVKGRIVYCQKYPNEIDISKLKPGVYLLRVATDKNIFSEKIILK